MVEEWKDIKGYEGYYQVSNLGRVKRLLAWRGNQVKHVFIPVDEIVKPYIDNFGYKRVCLSKDCKSKHFRVHRLVAIAFIPNPYNLPEVNHKDEDKSNSCVDNLEWCTHAYNSAYGTRGIRIGKTNHNGKGAKRSVLQFDLNNNFIKRWKSMQEAHDTLGISVSKICSCCRGYCKTGGGFIWKYEFPHERDKEE